MKRTPSLVILNSGLWDLLDWTRQAVRDADNGKEDALDVMSPKRVGEYETSLKAFLQAALETFPDSHLYWRTLPSTPISNPQWGLQDISSSKDGAKRRALMFRNSYIDALNAVSKRVLRSDSFVNRVGVLNWHGVTVNDQTWIDDVHPDGRSTETFLNLVFYELVLNRDSGRMNLASINFKQSSTTSPGRRFLVL